MSSSDSDDEATIRYGTPLEPYEEDEVPAKRRFQQNTEQYAVDAHGKRRFHGAFTGGFTAGHGNSVSTPEGWTPAAFKSSRTEREAFKTRAPEDFMDEEDRDEFGIAPRLIQTQSDFAGQKRPHTARRFHDGPIPGEPVLEQFVRVVPETAAVRLLRGMGWRPGSGAGEQKPRAKTYGCYVPPEFRLNADEAEDSDGSDVDYSAVFAPEDYEPYLLSRKDDLFGLGYTGLSRHSVLGSTTREYGSGDATMSHLKMKDKGKKVSIRGQAFGVGALEDEDEDVYSLEDMSHYDFTLGGPSKEKEQVKGKTKSEGLEGFVRASKAPPTQRRYPAPVLPRDYVPAPAGFARTRFTPAHDVDVHRKQGLGRHELNSQERGALLGEPSVEPASTPLCDPSGDILAHLSNTVNTNSRDQDEESGSEMLFRPFSSDAAKQLRYERFLRGEEAAEGAEGRVAEWEAAREKAEFEQAAKLYKPLTGVLRDRFTAGSGAEDAPAGKSEKLYGSEEQVGAARSGMYGALTRSRAEWRPESLVCKRFNVPDPFNYRPDTSKTDRPKSSYSVFDYLEGSIHSKESFTKEQTQFSGSKSLQQHNSTISTAIKKAALPIPQPIEAKPSVETEKIQGNKKISLADLFLLEAEKERLNRTEHDVEEVTQTIDKFDKMELYNAIFMSDSEDDDVNDEKADKNDSDFKETQVNVERNLSPPRGIFANLDFEQLNSWSSKSKTAQVSLKVNDEPIPTTFKEKNEQTKRTDLEKNNANEPSSSHITTRNTTPEKGKCRDMDISELFESPKVDESNLYGPKIPENLRKNIELNAIEPDSTIFFGNTSVSRTAYKELDIEDVFLNNNKRAELPRPLFRDKHTRQKTDEVVEVRSSSSDSDAWVDISKAKSKTQKKKKKKHKHKSKKRKKVKEK